VSAADESMTGPCECYACGGCPDPATTTDEGGDVCAACAEYAVDEGGEVYCSRCPEYEDAGEWTGGGMCGTTSVWVSRPKVRAVRS